MVVESLAWLPGMEADKKSLASEQRQRTAENEAGDGRRIAIGEPIPSSRASQSPAKQMHRHDDDPLAARIFKDFINILSKPLDEYEIVATENQLVNKCPLILVDGKLGIDSWCLPILIQHVQTRFFRLKHESSDQVDDASRVMLMLIPELATAWNVRRRLCLLGKREIAEELKFSELVLTRKPKSPDAFSYRQFLIAQMQKTGPLPHQITINELRVCLDAASRYRRNYYAWRHRFWIMEQSQWLSSVQSMHTELQTTAQWMERHVSDYSVFHYRQILIIQIKSLTACIRDLIQSELRMLESLLKTFVDRESLFLHRRFIIQMMSEQGEEWTEREKRFIERQKVLAGDDSWRLLLIQRHQKWLEHCFQTNF